jgi:hypothetical protein
MAADILLAGSSIAPAEPFRRTESRSKLLHAALRMVVLPTGGEFLTLHALELSHSTAAALEIFKLARDEVLRMCGFHRMGCLNL